MVTSEYELLKILADGRLHSGQELADNTGVSRTAIWKHLAKMREKHLEIVSFKGRGYRLPRQIELLHSNDIRGHLKPSIQRLLQSVELFYETASTNQVLMDKRSTHGNVVLAEYQHAGRGRCGNNWLTGLASGLCVSIGWHYEAIPGDFSALSLATGVKLAQCLEKYTGIPIHLKWPNDLVHNRCKLGGVLIESRGQHAGAVDVVVGIGINFNLPQKLSELIQQDVTDLVKVFGRLPPRNYIAGEVINNIVELLIEYPDRGFSQYIGDWRKLDIGKGCEAELRLPNKKISGYIVDIDENGNLIMSVNGKLLKYGSGELSLRLLN